MSYYSDNSYRYNYIMNKGDRKCMWGAFSAVTLTGAAFTSDNLMSSTKQYKIDQAQKKIDALELQQASSKSDTVFMMPAAEKHGPIQLLAQENIETLTSTTYTELLEPLYQERENAMQKEISGIDVGFCIGVGLASSFIANAFFVKNGGDALYEKAGMALNKLFSKRKKNKKRVIRITI